MHADVAMSLDHKTGRKKSKKWEKEGKELGLPRKAARAHLELDGTSRMYATQV